MSVQKRAEKTNPKPNWLELEETKPIQREWQKGTALLIVGIILLAFDVMFGIVFVPSDWRAGTLFWTTVAIVETVISLALIVVGLLMKRHASFERAAEKHG